MNSNEITLFDQVKDLIRLGWTDSKIALELNISMVLVEAYRRLSECEEVKEKEEETSVNMGASFVKLSLKEYEEMQRKIRDTDARCYRLELENDRLMHIIEKLGIPGKIINKIGRNIPLSCCWQDDLANNKRKYRIDFEVDPRDLMGE